MNKELANATTSRCPYGQFHPFVPLPQDCPFASLRVFLGYFRFVPPGRHSSIESRAGIYIVNK